MPEAKNEDKAAADAAKAEAVAKAESAVKEEAKAKQAAAEAAAKANAASKAASAAKKEAKKDVLIGAKVTNNGTHPLQIGGVYIAGGATEVVPDLDKGHYCIGKWIEAEIISVA